MNEKQGNVRRKGMKKTEMIGVRKWKEKWEEKEGTGEKQREKNRTEQEIESEKEVGW